MSETDKKTWQTPFYTAFRARWPKAAWQGGQAGKYLAPLVEEYTVLDVADEFAAYCALTDPMYFSFARFSQGYGEWAKHAPAAKAALTGPPVVDGWLSSEADVLTRP